MPAPPQLGSEKDTADCQSRWDTKAEKRSWRTMDVVFVADAADAGIAAAVSECRHRTEQNPKRQKSDFHLSLLHSAGLLHWRQHHFVFKWSRQLKVNLSESQWLIN
jgi:hypothetical protein